MPRNRSVRYENVEKDVLSEPTMLVLRRGTASDLSFFTRAVLELETDDPPPSPEKWARELEPYMFVAEQDGAPVGYSIAQAMGEIGHLKHIVTMPHARKRGVAHALLLAAAAQLRSEGCTEWMLNVKVENHAAKALYAKLGLQSIYESGVVRVPWELALSLPTELGEVREPSHRDDRSVEQTFKLVDGMLAQRRDLGRILRIVEVDGAVTAFAAFDPTFPGAYPFQAQSQQAAGTLLRALYEVRRPDLDFINLVIERDPTLFEQLVASGAEPRMRMENWRGKLNLAR